MRDTSIYPLTAREFDVTRLLADGLTNEEIGSQLGIKKATVGTHVENVYAKLHARNRVEAARWYWRGRMATLLCES